MNIEPNEQTIFEKRAQELARSTDTSSYRQSVWAGAVVLIGGERYGFPVSIVSRVVKCPKITKLPRTPSHMWGVVALRGQVLSVVDVAALLGARASVAGSLLLIIEGSGGLIGVPIETLVGLRTVFADEISTVLMPGTDERGLVISRTKDFVSLLDAEKFLAAEEIRLVSNPIT
jgi:purine-binding chemotaxis protein CheW